MAASLSCAFAPVCAFAADASSPSAATIFGAAFVASALGAALGARFLSGRSGTLSNSPRPDSSANKISSTARPRNAKPSSKSDELYALAFESNPEPAAVAELLSDGRLVLSRSNATFLRLAGVSSDAVGGELSSILSEQPCIEELLSLCQESARTGRLLHREFSLRGHHGDSLVVFGIVPSVEDPSKVVLVGQDVTALRKEQLVIDAANKKLESLAHFDALTRLPNRALLMDRLEQTLVAAERDFQKRAVMFLDLDNFKIVNDTKGHEAGDLLLIEASRRIAECARSNDTVARLGGDEFVVLLNDIKEGPEIGHIAERIIASLTTPFSIHGDDFHVGTSIGVAVYPDDGCDAATLMKNADAAMYVSKENGKNRFTFFHEEMNAANSRRVALEREALASIEENTFSVAWLPHFELASSRIFAVEASPVWTSPLLSSASSDELAQVLEAGTVARKLSDKLLFSAAEEYKALLRDLPSVKPPVFVVPVAGILLRERDFPGRVSALMREHSMPDNSLEIAAPEEALTGRDPKKTAATISALRAAGARVALDRFGAGSVGLSRLASIPVQSIRIDQRFIANIGKGPQNEAMINAAISIARSLEAFSIACGVETHQQIQWLRRHGCRAACGSAYSKPLSPAELFDKLRKQGAAS